MRFEGAHGREEERWRIGSQCAREMLSERERCERRDRRCAPNLQPPSVSTMRGGGCSARSGDLQTFIVLIASCACSIVSTSIHSVVWGSKSWFMISILSSEVLMDASAAILKLLTYCGRNGAAGHFCSEIWIMDLQLRGGSRRLSVAARALQGLVVLKSRVCRSRWPMPGSGAH